MALQSIPRFDPTAGFGDALTSGLQQLAQGKLQQEQQRGERLRYQQGILGIPGMKPEVAQLLANVDPETRKLLLPNIDSLLNAYTPQQQGGLPAELMGSNAAPAAQGMAVQPAAQGTNVGNLFKSPGVRRDEEKLNLQKLQYVQPIAEKIEDKARPAREVKKYAEQALNYIDKAISGAGGRITPAYLQSEAGQNLTNLLDNIVIIRAQQGKGVPSRVRLELEKGAKAAIWNKPKVIRQILERIIEDPEVNEDIAMGQASKNILENLDNYDLTKFNSLVRQQGGKILKGEREQRASSFTQKTLPDASKYTDGAKAKNPVTGEYQFIVRNGKWEKI